MALPLSGKTAIVTGASRGIGAAIATRLATDGASVVVNYNGSEALAQRVTEDINKHTQGRAVSIRADLSLVEEGRRVVEETVRMFGQVDILVFNAGIAQPGKLDGIDEAQFDAYFNVTVKVPLFMAQTASKFMQPGGRIIFISSQFTTLSTLPTHYLLYIASKGTVEQLTRVLAQDLGTRGITVNAVSPGPIDTDMLRVGVPEEVRVSLANSHPQKRIGTTADVEPVIAFLVREEAGWVNGESIMVSGGMSV